MDELIARLEAAEKRLLDILPEDRHSNEYAGVAGELDGIRLAVSYARETR